MIAWILAWAPAAGAASLAELRGLVNALRASGTVELGRQQSILAALDHHARQFYSVVNSGREAEAKAFFEALHPVLRDLHDWNKAKTEGMVQATIAADGDLEATQTEQAFRDAEIARLRALYNLNWVSYLGATLLSQGEPRRRQLLEFAAENFGEFVIGPDEAIARESLLGRAQALKELGRTDEALVDFHRLIGMGSQVPQYTLARVGAVEALLAAGRGAEAAREADAVVSDAAAGRLAAEKGIEARLLKAQALFVTLKKSQAAPADRAATMRSALALLREVERNSPAWRRKVAAVADWGLKGLPEADLAAGSGLAGFAVAESLILKGNYAGALAKLEAFLAGAGAPANERAQAHFHAGLSAFQLNRYLPAARHLKSFLDMAPGSGDAPEASYLFFKALEQIAKVQPSVENERRFRTALRSFLERYPQHPANAEARFRLGEILRDDGDALAAVGEFRRVKGNATLEIYAEFNAAQAMFSRLHAPLQPGGEEAMERERQETIAALEQLVARLAKSAGGEAASEELGAKASLMAAILATEGKSPDYAKALALTGDFGQRFPNRPELARQAFAMEILALQKAGDPARAEKAVTAYLDTYGGETKERERLLKRLGREFFAQSENERAGKRPDLAEASARIAIAIYLRLRAESGGSARAKEALRGIHAMLATLHARIGEDGKAASEYAALLGIDPRSEEALRGLAEIAARTGDHRKSSEYWTALAAVLDREEPEWLNARYAAANAAGVAGNALGACRAVQETRELSPYPLTGADKLRFGQLERRVCGG